MEEMLYTVKEVAELLKTNQNYIHRLRKVGLLRFLKLGSFKVRKSELERFLADNEGKDLTDPSHIKNLESDEKIFIITKEFEKVRTKGTFDS